jgi:lipopolysaccharide heptosyltransferase III
MVKDAVPLEECGRALVIKLRHHGDVLLAAPVLSVLKARGVEVDALVYDDTAPMLQGHPALSQLHVVGRNWKAEGAWPRFLKERRLFADLKGRSYGLIVHLSEQPRGAWLARTLGARYSVAPRVAGRGSFWERSFTHLFPSAPRRHMVEVNLDALRRIGVQPDMAERRVEFVPGPEADTKIQGLLKGEFVHVHPASRWRFKCWPAEKNAELIDRLAADGHHVVITAAPDREELGFVDEIKKATRSKPLDLSGKLSIKELGALAARAKLFVGVDSMPMHLACAMGTPAVVLFGPSGEAEWGPWNVAHRVVHSAHSCRPCGQDGCGGGKVSECLSFLPVDAVHAAARELLAR